MVLSRKGRREPTYTSASAVLYELPSSLHLHHPAPIRAQVFKPSDKFNQSHLIEHPDDEGHHDKEAAQDGKEAEQVRHLSSGDQEVSELGRHGNQQLNLEAFVQTQVSWAAIVTRL